MEVIKPLLTDNDSSDYFPIFDNPAKNAAIYNKILLHQAIHLNFL